MKHPKQGGRVLLERAEVADDRVRYRVTLYTPEAEWWSHGVISVQDGDVALEEPWQGDGGGGPPEWLVEGARAFLRTVWNGRRREPEPMWPRRVLRWREPRH